MVKTYKDYLIVTVDRDNINVRELLLEKGVSRKLFLKLYNQEKISLGKKSIRKGQLVKEGDEILLEYLLEEDSMEASKIELDIVYEDTDILVVNKPSGQVSHPIKYYTENTLLNGVKYYFEKNQIGRNPRLVNRLDKDTEGLIIVAKNPYIDSLLSDMIKKGKIVRKYIAVVEGNLKNPIGTIDKPIFQPAGEMQRIISNQGQKALTRYSLIKENQTRSLVQVELETGRSHQIRVHFQSLGNSLVNDKIYGTKEDLEAKMLLCSYYLEFIHPISKKEMIFTLNKSFDEYLNIIENY